MHTDEQLLEKLENSIEALGHLWHQMGDGPFGNEREMQCYIPQYLGTDESMFHSFSMPFSEGEIQIKTPLIHMEYPARSNYKHHFDLALLSPNSIEKVVSGDFQYESWQERVTKQNGLAAIEIKQVYTKKNVDLSDDLAKLSHNKEQFPNSYLLVFYNGWHGTIDGSPRYPEKNAYDHIENILSQWDKPENAGIRLYLATNIYDIQPCWYIKQE